MRARLDDRGDHVVGLVAVDPQVAVAERLDQRLEVRPLLLEQVRAGGALRLVVGVELLAAGVARVPDDDGRLRPVVGEDLHEHRREPEDRVRRHPGRGRDRLGQREERPVGEAVAVDQEELVWRECGGHLCQAISAAVAATPSAQYSLTLRVEIDHRPGMLGKVASAIGDAGGTIGAVDLVQVERRAHDPRHHRRDRRRLRLAAADRRGQRGRRGARARHHRPDVHAARRGQDRDPATRAR